MRALLQIVWVLAMAIVGFVAGGMVGAQFVPDGQGLAGGATVFLWAVGGTIAGIVASVMMRRGLGQGKR